MHVREVQSGLEEFSSCFMRKLWWLEMVNFIEVLEDIGCFGFGMSVCMFMSIWNGFGIS